MAAVAMPIAFIEQSGRYLPVAIMSPQQGRNLFIGPNGQWLGIYVPAALRSYPFSPARVEGSDKLTICIDEDSGWVVNAAANPDAPKFFEEDGSPSGAIKAALDLVTQIEHNRSITDLAVAALAEARIIQPWPITVTDGNQQVPVKGFHRIDEAALNALDDQTFLKLRKSGSLVLAYAQLISMRTIGVFGQMTGVQQQLAHQEQLAHRALFDSGMVRFS